MELRDVFATLDASMVARLLEVPDGAIAAGIDALESLPGRMEPIDEGQTFSVFVDYAHKPEALEAVLSTFSTPLLLSLGSECHAVLLRST